MLGRFSVVLQVVHILLTKTDLTRFAACKGIHPHILNCFLCLSSIVAFNNGKNNDRFALQMLFRKSLLDQEAYLICLHQNRKAKCCGTNSIFTSAFKYFNKTCRLIFFYRFEKQLVYFDLTFFLSRFSRFDIVQWECFFYSMFSCKFR